MEDIIKLLYSIQPSILKCKTNEELPEDIRGKYVICLPLPNMYDYNPGKELLYGIPAVIIKINNRFLNELSIPFENFIKKVQEDPNNIYDGVNDFNLGSEYYITQSFYDKVSSNQNLYVVPDYYLFEQFINIDTDEYITGFNINYYELDEMLNIHYKDFSNLNTFEIYNEIGHKYTEDELKNFYQTFCSIIIKYNKDDFSIDEIQNIIYKKVLEYFANGQSDEGLTNLKLILNNTLLSNNKSSCACQEISSNVTAYGVNTNGNSTGLLNTDLTSSTSCIEAYMNNMLSLLSKMLGDSNFYKNFFLIDLITDISKPTICEDLIELIDEFLNLVEEGIISLNIKKNKTNDLACPVVSDNTSECNIQIILNYRKVLEWVRDNQIDENINKIKIYGQQFGDLLPNLDFAL